MTDATEKLLAIAAESANLSVNEVLSSLASPDWETQRSDGSDWKLYVPKPVQLIWDAMGQEARLTAFIAGLEASSNPSDCDYWGV